MNDAAAHVINITPTTKKEKQVRKFETPEEEVVFVVSQQIVAKRPVAVTAYLSDSSKFTLLAAGTPTSRTHSRSEARIIYYYCYYYV